MDGGPKNRDEREAMRALRELGPRRLLLEGFTRGRYAAQVGRDPYNPYRDDPEMADAWFKGFESAGRDRETSTYTQHTQ